MAYNNYQQSPYSPNQTSTNSQVQTSPYTKSANPIGITDPGQGSNKQPTGPSVVHNHYWAAPETPTNMPVDAAATGSDPTTGRPWGTGQSASGPTHDDAVRAGNGGFVGPQRGGYDPSAPPVQSYGPMVTPNGGVPPGMPYAPVQPPNPGYQASMGVAAPAPITNLDGMQFNGLQGSQAGPYPDPTNPSESIPWAQPAPAPVPTQTTPAGQAAPGQAAPAQPQNFGNLGDPSTWMNLVRNPTQLAQWVRSGLGPNASDQLVNYYVGKIQQQPGANLNEQAGSAGYWMDKLQRDPNIGPTPGGAPGDAFGPQPGIMGQQYNLISQLMSGGPISPEVIALMNSQNQATTAQAGQDALRQYNQGAAGRGVFQGGTAAAMRAKLADNAMKAQLSGQRSVGIQAPQINYNSLISALAGGQNVIGANNQLGYAYNNANASLEQQFINALMNLNQG